MKQAEIKGLGSKGRGSVAPAIAPANMPDAVVAACKGSEAAAVRYSLMYARNKFGWNQLDVYRRSGWKGSGSSYLSEIAKGHKDMPEARVAAFLHATGCALLEQVRERARNDRAASGALTQNERDAAVLAEMLREAA